MSSRLPASKDKAKGKAKGKAKKNAAEPLSYLAAKKKIVTELYFDYTLQSKRTWVMRAQEAVDSGMKVFDLTKCSPGQPAEVQEFVDWCLQLEKEKAFAVIRARKCGLGREEAQIIAQLLPKNRSLQVLDLRANYIEDAGAQSIAEALHKNKSLKKLHLGGNMLKQPCAQHLARALRKSKVLRELYLGGDEGNDMGVEGARVFAEALPQCASLRVLDLSMCGIGPEGAKFLGRSLLGQEESGPQLVKLTLTGDDIGDVGAEGLACALRDNRKLRVLNLMYNGIRSDGARHLSEALVKNTTLRVLALGGNYVGPEGADYLAKALRKNGTLLNLQLGGNQIGVDGSKSMCGALKKNRALLRLSLGGNQIGDTGAAYIAEGLRKNRSLLELMMTDNGIGEEGSASFIQAMHGNDTLRELNLELNAPVDEMVRKELRELVGRNRLAFGHSGAFSAGYRTDASMQYTDDDFNQDGRSDVDSLDEEERRERWRESLLPPITVQ